MHFKRSAGRNLAVMIGAAIAAAAFGSGRLQAQIVYETLRPVPYVANYVPSGNYAAVTAFSPPMVSGVPVVAGYAPAVAAPVVASVPSSSLAVTSYYSPGPPAVAPVTAYYAPAAVPVTTYYAPTAEVVAPVVAAPVAAYYPPTMTVRRGLFGAYRYRYNPGGWYAPY